MVSRMAGPSVNSPFRILRVSVTGSTNADLLARARAPFSRRKQRTRRLALGVDYGRGREVALPALYGERPPNICLFWVDGECEEEEDSRFEPCQWFGGVRFGFELCKRGRRLRLASRAGRTGPPHSFHSAGRWQWGERGEVAAQEGSEVGVGEAASRAEELVQVVPGKGPNEAGGRLREITGGDYGRLRGEITGDYGRRRSELERRRVWWEWW